MQHQPRGKPSAVEDSIPNGSGGQPGHANGGSTSAESATTLLNEATVLLKSLKSLKAMKLKQINVDATTSWRLMALLDGDDATHGLRMAYASEINQLEQVEVELASGTAFLYRHPAHKTLLSKTPIDPIVPLHHLVQMGYRTGLPVAARSITQWWRWFSAIFVTAVRWWTGMALWKFRRGWNAWTVAVWVYKLRELRWWKERFPLVPDRVLRRFLGQGEEWDPDLLPWNRRQRRAHARRVAIHLFSGSSTKKWIRPGVGDYEWIFIDTCLGSRFDLHRPVVWSYLWGRGLERFDLANLSSEEMELVDGDAALFLKQVALWRRAEEVC